MKKLLMSLALVSILANAAVSASEVMPSDASCGPPRGLCPDINSAFAAQWTVPHGDHVPGEMPHAGSGKQARAVVDTSAGRCGGGGVAEAWPMSLYAPLVGDGHQAQANAFADGAIFDPIGSGT